MRLATCPDCNQTPRASDDPVCIGCRQLLNLPRTQARNPGLNPSGLKARSLAPSSNLPACLTCRIEECAPGMIRVVPCTGHSKARLVMNGPSKARESLGATFTNGKWRTTCGALTFSGAPCARNAERGGPCRWHRDAAPVPNALHFSSTPATAPVVVSPEPLAFGPSGDDGANESSPVPA